MLFALQTHFRHCHINCQLLKQDIAAQYRSPEPLEHRPCCVVAESLTAKKRKNRYHGLVMNDWWSFYLTPGAL